MSSWSTYLENFRAQETEWVFRGCPAGLFENALELGAGNGAQSKHISKYAKHLISTDLNQDRLVQVDVPGIEYRICDAELVGESFASNTFDLVFASNLFEHLPSPSAALAGVHSVLKSDGVVILVLPNALWKAASLLGFYPNMLRLSLRAVRDGRVNTLLSRYVTGGDRAKNSHEKKKGNNLKSGTATRRAGIFWPEPHGAYSTHLAEFIKYRKKRWIAEFVDSGFDVLCVRPGPVSSGYGFGFYRMRALLEYCGVATEFIYVLKKAGSADTKYAQYWLNSARKPHENA